MGLRKMALTKVRTRDHTCPRVCLLIRRLVIWPSDVKLCIEDKSTGVQSDANDKEDIIKVESYIIDDVGDLLSTCCP